MKRCVFAVFQQISEKQMGEFAASIERSKAKKCFSFRRLRPLTPRPGALPLDPRYRLAVCALSMFPPLPNPKYATACDVYLIETSQSFSR